MVKSWKAHNDAINCVKWIKELSLIGTCSYDCNVYLWAPDGTKNGSLVLGNKATAPGAALDPETAKYRRGWKVQVDKMTQYKNDLVYAERLWRDVEKLDYKEMKAKALERARKKEGLSAQERAQKEAK